MKYVYDKYPFDVLLCLLISILLIPLAIAGISGAIRIAIGLPVILFIPGYLFMFAIYPYQKQKNKGIDTIERIALSFGLSLAIVPLIGLGLNYTPWGLTLPSILTSNILFIVIMSIISYYCWIKTAEQKRFIISFELNMPKHDTTIDKLLTIFLIASILILASTIVYALITPRQGEQFTEFYILGENGMLDDYPQQLNEGENGTVIIGIANHEYQQMNYTIEIWLSEEETIYNTTTEQNKTIYEHLYYYDNLTVSLPHTDADIEKDWQEQWETPYSFSINQTGTYNLYFLLYTDHITTEYDTNTDYASIAEQKLDPDQRTAYRALNLLITVE